MHLFWCNKARVCALAGVLAPSLLVAVCTGRVAIDRAHVITHPLLVSFLEHCMQFGLLGHFWVFVGPGFSWAPRGCLPRLLGLFWGFWASTGLFWVALGHIWAVTGPFWAVLGLAGYFWFWLPWASLGSFWDTSGLSLPVLGLPVHCTIHDPQRFWLLCNR